MKTKFKISRSSRSKGIVCLIEHFLSVRPPRSKTVQETFLVCHWDLIRIKVLNFSSLGLQDPFHCDQLGKVCFGLMSFMSKCV